MNRRAIRAMSVLSGVAAAVVALTASTASLALPSLALPSLARQPVTTASPRLELVEQRFAVDPNGDIALSYLLTGLVDDPLQLAPVPQPVPEPTPEPVSPDGVVPDTVVPEPVVPALPQLTLEITNYSPVTDPDDVARLVGSDVDADVFELIGDAVDGVAIDARPLMTRNEDGTVGIVLDIGTDVVDSVGDRLKLEQPGLYPLRIELLLGDPADDDVIATAGTIVQRVAGAVDADVDTPPPIDLSIVTVTSGVSPSADAATIDAAQTSLDRSIDLATAIDAPVTLEVPPTLIAARAETPEGADGLAVALADDELVALPIVPLDVSSAVGADQADAYTRLVSAGEDLLTESVPTVPSRREIWITADPLSAAGAQLLRDLGTRFVVMTPELFESTTGVDVPTTDRFVDAELPDGGTLSILVVDPLAEQLTEEAADRALERSTAAEWSVETLAVMLAEQAESDDAERFVESRSGAPARRSRILTTPDLTSPDVRLVQALERLAATTPAVRFVAASTLTGVTDVLLDDDEPVTVQLPEEAGPSLVARVELLQRTALELASAGSMLPEGDQRVDDWSSRLDLLISTGYTDAEVEAIVAELMAEAEAVKAAVQLPEPFTFTLTGRRGTIEVRIGNTSDEPLNVAVALDSEKITFPDGDQLVTLRPVDETSVIVPVDAEANGTSSINLVVSTPAGEALGDPVTITARVTALTGLGQVLTGGLALVLVTWWFTHWRARRRAALADDGRERHPSSRELESDPL